jgi:hypothetical protein
VLEQSTLFPCEDIGAPTQAMKVTARLFKHLYSKVIPTLDGIHSKGLRIDLLLVGFGYHNIGLIETELRNWIAAIIIALENHPTTSSSAILFWILPHKVVPSRFPAPRNVTDAGKKLVHAFNDLVMSMTQNISGGLWTFTI